VTLGFGMREMGNAPARQKLPDASPKQPRVAFSPRRAAIRPIKQLRTGL
jgi:hypothetical protein